MATQTLENPVIQVSGTATIEPNIEVAELVQEQDGQAITTSLKIAEIFNKQHKNVLQSIRELDCSDDFRGLNFQPSLKIRELPNGMGNRQDPYYLITRDGFVFLVMGFTGKTAAKFKEAYIRAFNEMEERLRQRKQLEQQQRAAKAARPQLTIGDLPGVVHEQLQQTGSIVELRGQQRVVSTVTLAGLTGRRHKCVCDSVRSMFKHVLRPKRLFIRDTRTVRRGYGEEADGGVIYYITIEGFNVMRTHCKSISSEVADEVLAAFRKAKGRTMPGWPHDKEGSKPKPRQPKPRPQQMQQPQAVTPNLPTTPNDMMQRFVTAMAVMMGVDVNQMSNVINGGNK